MNVLIIGCGNIAPVYVGNLVEADEVDKLYCVDAEPERASALAQRRPEIVPLDTVDRAISSTSIDLVLNLTNPSSHAGVTEAALQAGKHVYSEKPLATNLADALRLQDLASRSELRLACAPDTLLGPSWQAARTLVDSGQLGRLVHIHGAMITRGHERWHPNPDFYYQAGGGPIWDMGPYYLSAMIALMGPVEKVTAVAKRTWPLRVIGSGPRMGNDVVVETDTHITALIQFLSGAVGTLVTSFDAWPGESPKMELFAENGSLALPDPNRFDGPVLLKMNGDPIQDQVSCQPASDNLRGLGVVEMIQAIRAGRPHECSAELAVHVVEVIEAIEASAASGMAMSVGTAQPA